MITLWPFQEAAAQHWDATTSSGGTRASMILPTGVGKTVLAASLLPTGEADRTVFFVPTVVLLSQTCRHLLTAHPHLRLLRVCSATAAAVDTDEAVSEAQLAARKHIDATTDPDTIVDHLRGPGPSVLVATYASAPAVHAAAEASNTTFSLCICDEAHRTAGAPDKAWSLPVRREFPAQRRLFMTATARTITIPTTPAATAAITEIGWDTAEIISMDSVESYGPHISTLSFREAITQGYLSDYEIALIGVASRDAHRQLATIVAASPTDYTITDAAAHLALIRASHTHPHIQSVLAFHNRITQSKIWTEQLLKLSQHLRADTGAGRLLTAVHIDGNTDPEDQRQALSQLATPGDRMHVVSNCRVFAEGIDVPALDAVLFAAPRTSGPDIVQIVGRAIRKHPRGTHHKALIIVPVLLAGDADDTAADVAAARTSHLAAWRILTSLADQDELLHHSLLTWRDDVADGQGPRTGPVVVDLPEGLDEVARDVVLRTIDRTIPSHLRTAAYLRDFHAVHGHTRTKPHTTFKKFPLGSAVRAAQAAKRAGTLPQRLVEEFEEIDGFAWVSAHSAAQRTADEWIDLVQHFVDKTGIHTLEPYTPVIDPNTGMVAKIGNWYHTKSRRKNYLTTQQRRRLDTILTP